MPNTKTLGDKVNRQVRKVRTLPTPSDEDSEEEQVISVINKFLHQKTPFCTQKFIKTYPLSRRSKKSKPNRAKGKVDQFRLQ